MPTFYVNESHITDRIVFTERSVITEITEKSHKNNLTSFPNYQTEVLNHASQVYYSPTCLDHAASYPTIPIPRSIEKRYPSFLIRKGMYRS